MGGDWRETTLDQLGPIATGKTPPSRNPEYFGGKVPFVTPTDFDGRRRIDTTNRCLTEKGAIAVRRARIPRESVMVSCIGSDMGKSAIAGRACVTNQQINAIVVEPPNLPLFVFYNLSMRKEEIRATAGGSAQPILNKSAFGKLDILLPTSPEQRTIVHVLGTLDDKIELNRRMNETLERMARALFKSWFVDFDPVRAKMKGRDTGLPRHLSDLFPDRLVESELGEIPAGWKVKPLSNFGKIVTGKTPSTRNLDFYGNDIPFLKIPDMHGKVYAVKTETMLSKYGADSQGNKTLPPGSISVSCIATPGLVVLNHQETQTNQQINSIVPHDCRAGTYLYWSCRRLASEIMLIGSGGSVFQNMNKSTFSALKIIDAGEHLRRLFDETIAPIHYSILNKEKTNQYLAGLRDLLLPQLVSGELRLRATVPGMP